MLFYINRPPLKYLREAEYSMSLSSKLYSSMLLLKNSIIAEAVNSHLAPQRALDLLSRQRMRESNPPPRKVS